MVWEICGQSNNLTLIAELQFVSSNKSYAYKHKNITVKFITNTKFKVEVYYMVFSIVTDTAGARVGELASELRNALETNINSKYSNVDVSIGIVFRCLPESYGRKSFIRYTKKDNYLTIDIAVTVEEYEKMYKVEQRYNLEKLFIEFLNTALEKYTFEGLEKERFISDIKVWAGEIPLKMDNGSSKLGNWFNEEIDWSVDLDK
ncbi:hypothetical protein [Lysinibacillus sp. C5.1]|uniref:hypothetical protein n=1 Tax=Lysinibacillus sp. C5.1 TaxID=2796169 RepID=UPI003081B4B9